MGKAALFFDLDGTLLMSDPIHQAVFADLLAPRGLAVDEAPCLTHIHGRRNLGFFAEFLPAEPKPEALSDTKEAKFRRRLPSRLPRPCPAKPGVIGARGHSDIVVSGEECARGKPHPDPGLEAMALPEVPPARTSGACTAGLRPCQGEAAPYDPGAQITAQATLQVFTDPAPDSILRRLNGADQ